MNVILVNLGSVAVPVSSSQDKGWATMLDPNEPFILNSPAVTVASVGDNPSFSEELTEGVQNIIEQLGKLVTFWRDHTEQQIEGSPGTVLVQIENRGPNALRVLLGINTNEVTVNAGTTYEAEAPGYVEIRELGV